MPQKQKASISDMVDKLVEVSVVMKNRMGLKPAESDRVRGAFELLAAGMPPTDARGRANKLVYVEFLQRVQHLLGSEGVVLCAVGLGVSAVASMGDKRRVDLPHELNIRWQEIPQDSLKGIADEFSKKYFPSPTGEERAASPCPAGGKSPSLPGEHREMEEVSQFAGDAYALTWDDVRQILGSACVGQPYFIDTFSDHVNSFAIVPVSQELTNHFVRQRQKHISYVSLPHN
ncbi:hypothetical protein RB600_006439 [Gaeumannomyces tritici]